MARVKFEFNDKQLKKLLSDIIKESKKPLSPGQLNRIGQLFIRDMKRTIAKGNSPVRALGRFKQYSDSYKAQIKSSRAAKKSPFRNKFPRKVNLKLSGGMLKGLIHKALRNGVLSIRYKTGRPKKLAGFSDGYIISIWVCGITTGHSR